MLLIASSKYDKPKLMNWFVEVETRGSLIFIYFTLRPSFYSELGWCYLMKGSNLTFDAVLNIKRIPAI